MLLFSVAVREKKRLEYMSTLVLAELFFDRNRYKKTDLKDEVRPKIMKKTILYSALPAVGSSGRSVTTT